MKFFWGLLLLATAVVSLKVHEQRGIRELSESDFDIIKKSKEIKETLQAEHREPTDEEHAVLAQWEQIHENKQDELKAAGIIDRRASVPVRNERKKCRSTYNDREDRAYRPKMHREAEDLNLKKQSAPKVTVETRETGDKRALTDEELNFFLKAKAISDELEQTKREPTDEEAGTLFAAAFIAMANVDELKDKGLIPKERRELANKDKVQRNPFWTRHSAPPREVNYNREIPIFK